MFGDSEDDDEEKEYGDTSLPHDLCLFFHVWYKYGKQNVIL